MHQNQKAQTTNSMRRFVAIIGETNSGKSSLFNALTGQDNAIVSSERGTTTDPVQKAMELIPFGPIVLIDTAGFSDESTLGIARMNKTRDVLRRCDCAVYVLDAQCPNFAAYDDFTRHNLTHILVITKCDLVADSDIAKLKDKFPKCLQVGGNNGVDEVKIALSSLLSSLQGREKTLFDGLAKKDNMVLFVTPIDSEAPKGRLILPQVQAIRDCLDHSIICTVTQVDGIKKSLEILKQVDLVVTDSQAFSEVSNIIPKDMPLTSFSMLLAHQKSDFVSMVNGAKTASTLQENAKILLLEGCTHNSTHEDIGRVKIPNMLRKKTGKNLVFDVLSGYDFPQDLSQYSLAISCGSCMLSQAEVENRGKLLNAANVPLTNYGIMLAWGAGILDRCTQVFKNNGEL